jgi:hypothetical protein
MWRMSDILETLAAGIGAVDARLRAEQSVHGVDALDEVGLHPVMAEALSAGGFGVLREVVYPGEHAKPVRKSARARCDLVLLPEPGMSLEDPVAEQALLAAGEGTLFAGLAADLGRSSHTLAPGEACWLEVKSVAQYAFVDGVPGPNRGYAEQLVKGPMGDLVKLARDPSIWTGAAVVVLFCESQAVGDHDLHATAHRLLDADLPVGGPEIGGVLIDDRVGNAWCGIGVYPVRAGG